MGRALRWLTDYTDAGIYKVLKRLGFSHKRALYFTRSPDPDYRAKWLRILRAYQEAWCHPQQVVLLFQDEFTYYRKADLRQRWLRQGGQLVMECPSHSVPATPSGWLEVDRRRYGRTTLLLLTEAIA